MTRETPRTDIFMFWFLLAPAGVLAAILYVSNAPIPAMMVGGLAFAVAVIVAPELGLYAYFAWQAMDLTFLAEETTVFTPGKGLALFMLVVYALRPGRVRVKMLESRPFVVAMLLFGCYGFLSAAFAVQPFPALRLGAQVVVQVLLLMMTLHTLSNRTYVSRALFCAVLGGLVAALFMLAGGAVSARFSRGTLGAFANPNTTGLALGIALMCVPAAWAYCRTKLLYVFYLAAAVLILAGMLKTGSRASLVAVIFALGLSTLLARRAGIVRRVLLPGLALLIACGTIYYVLQARILDPKSQERLEALITKRQQAVRQDARMFIWSLAMKTYLEQPYGFGYGNTKWALLEKHGYHRDVHSTFLGVLVDGGPISFALFAFGLWQLVRCTRRIGQSNPGIPAAMMLAFLGLSCLTHTIHFTKWFWVPATVCLLLVEQAARERQQQPGYAPSAPLAEPALPPAPAAPALR